MKIKRIDTYFFDPGVSKNLLFCRVEAEDGTYGWGEAYVTVGKEKVVDQYIQVIAPYMVGRDVYNIRHTSQVLYDDFAMRRKALDMFCAWSAIEIACWDIIGKRANLPVYKLLGGPMREKIKLYANGWWFGVNSIDGMAQRAAGVRDQGYMAMKFDPIPGPWRNFISQEDEDKTIDCVRAVREAVGPDVDLMIDGHRRLAPYHALRIVERLAEFNIAWYEEPCPPENIDLTVEFRNSVKKAAGIPIVTGESLYMPENFLPVLEKRAADILNPDTCVAGISGMLDIATMAKPYAIGISPHNYNSSLAGLAATVHVSALIPNFTIAEQFINLIEPCDEIASQALTIKDGWVDLPTTPGLGIDIDIEKLQKRPFRPMKGFPIPDYTQEFPRQKTA